MAPKTARFATRGRSGPTRNRLVAVAADTQQVLNRGAYALADDSEVSIGDRLRAAEAASVHHPEDEPLPVPRPAATGTTALWLWACSTLQAARRLTLNPGPDSPQPAAPIGVLNFASAKNPGGGWATGALAQEETLARASGLVPCLTKFTDEHYAPNRATHCGFYTDSIIFTPGVPVFKDDEGNYEPIPYDIHVLTAPAVNAGVALSPRKGRNRKADTRPASSGHEAEVARRMTHRIGRILAVFALHRCQTLVLGAFGCGVFRNDARQVAQTFRDALKGPFSGVFETVVFAIIPGPNLQAFEKVLCVKAELLSPVPPTETNGSTDASTSEDG